MPKSEIMYAVKADRRGGVFVTSDQEKAEQFARMKGTAVQIHAPSLSTATA